MPEQDRRDDWWKRKESEEHSERRLIVLYDDPDNCSDCRGEDLESHYPEEDTSEGLTIHYTCLRPGCGLHFDRTTMESVTDCPCAPAQEVSKKEVTRMRKILLWLLEPIRDLFRALDTLNRFMSGFQCRGCEEQGEEQAARCPHSLGRDDANLFR